MKQPAGVINYVKQNYVKQARQTRRIDLDRLGIREWFGGRSVPGNDKTGMVGATGFEPVTTRTPSVCATRLRYAPIKCLN